jgi:hypothetical protein
MTQGRFGSGTRSGQVSKIARAHRVWLIRKGLASGWLPLRPLEEIRL